MEQLNQFELTATPDTFQAIFGEGLYVHLWNKFSNRYNHSILALYRVLDSENSEKLKTYLAF
jgi:hypothetical protein